MSNLSLERQDLKIRKKDSSSGYDSGLKMNSPKS